MKIKKIIYILLFLHIIPPAYCNMPVVDMSNLVQNVEQTLRSVHIESATVRQIAQGAEALGNDVKMLMALHNQILLSKQNIENVAGLIREGKYKSIKELNQMCYSIQRVGRSVDGIGRTFEKLFPDTYEAIKEMEIRKILKEQEDEIDIASDDAIAIQDYLIDEEENRKVEHDIDSIMIRMESVQGIKGALQLQGQLLNVLINENRKLNTLLAASLQSNSLKIKKDIAEKKIKRKEHEQFMKGWGSATSQKNVLNSFP